MLISIPKGEKIQQKFYVLYNVPSCFSVFQFYETAVDIFSVFPFFVFLCYNTGLKERFQIRKEIVNRQTMMIPFITPAVSPEHVTVTGLPSARIEDRTVVV